MKQLQDNLSKFFGAVFLGGIALLCGLMFHIPIFSKEFMVLYLLAIILSLGGIILCNSLGDKEKEK